MHVMYIYYIGSWMGISHAAEGPISFAICTWFQPDLHNAPSPFTYKKVCRTVTNIQPFPWMCRSLKSLDVLS